MIGDVNFYPKRKEKMSFLNKHGMLLEFGMCMANVAREWPKGTVSIRHNTMNDVLRAKSLFNFGKKRERSLVHFALKASLMVVF